MVTTILSSQVASDDHAPLYESNWKPDGLFLHAPEHGPPPPPMISLVTSKGALVSLGDLSSRHYQSPHI